MANAIPMLEGTDASGGYLVRDTFGETLSKAIQRESAIARFARVERVAGKRQRYTVYSGRPTVAFTAEGAAKTSTGAEFTELAINVKKLAAITLYTEELLEDAVEDPRVLVNADLAEAFAYAIDGHALGYTDGTAIVGQFDVELTATTQTFEMGTGGDAFAVACSQAMAAVEGNGYKVNGIAAAFDLRAHMRDARKTVETTEGVYQTGFDREPDSLWGVPLAFTANLDALPAAAGKVAAVVGDWRQAILALRKDLTMRVSTEATVGGNSLFEQNKVAVLHEMRVGFNVHDVNRSFAVITNAA